MLKDLLDGVGNFGTDTITRDEGDLWDRSECGTEAPALGLTVYTPPYFVGSWMKSVRMSM
jgi:hypothetical protein